MPHAKWTPIFCLRKLATAGGPGGEMPHDSEDTVIEYKRCPTAAGANPGLFTIGLPRASLFGTSYWGNPSSSAGVSSRTPQRGRDRS